MAYFPNGDSGMFYEAEFCDHCIHQGPPDGPGCPVMLLHLMWNYDAVGKNADETKKTALNVFIPRSRDGLGNEACKMFARKK